MGIKIRDQNWIEPKPSIPKSNPFELRRLEPNEPNCLTDQTRTELNCQAVRTEPNSMCKTEQTEENPNLQLWILFPSRNLRRKRNRAPLHNFLWIDLEIGIEQNHNQTHRTLNLSLGYDEPNRTEPNCLAAGTEPNWKCRTEQNRTALLLKPNRTRGVEPNRTEPNCLVAGTEPNSKCRTEPNRTQSVRLNRTEQNPNL